MHCTLYSWRLLRGPFSTLWTPGSTLSSFRFLRSHLCGVVSRVLADAKPSILNPMLIGAALGLGLFARLSFLFVLPGLALCAVFCMVEVPHPSRNKKIAVWELLMSAMVFAILAVILLGSIMPNYGSYIEVVTTNTPLSHLVDVGGQWGHMRKKYCLIFSPRCKRHMPSQFHPRLPLIQLPSCMDSL